MSAHFPRLNRPEYPSSAEILLSALAWSVVPRKKAANRNCPVGLIYRRDSVKKPSSVDIIETYPTSNQSDLSEKWQQALAQEGLRAADRLDSERLANAVAHSLLGTRPLKGVSWPSSGIGIAGALLQDATGALAKPGPPQFAQIINSAFALGEPTGRSADSASGLWLAASTVHANSAALKPIELALLATTLREHIATPTPWPPSAAVLSDADSATSVPKWWESLRPEEIAQTPFGWFNTSWRRLCGPEWPRQLTPRRWSSWAACVLRHCLAFTYLWEANFFRELARGILKSDDPADSIARRALLPVRPLIPWIQGSVSEMNVEPGIKQLLSSGNRCREKLCQLANDLPPARTLPELVSALREKAKAAPPHFQTDLRASMSTSEDSGLVGEAVRYSLLARPTPDGTDPDYYGLLRTIARKYTHVAPAPEWIVVMSALSVEPTQATPRLGDVISSLHKIGLRPRIGFLLTQLEHAGLCASAADGDEGIYINLGFGS